MSLRAAYLDRIFHEAGISIVGLQETRALGLARRSLEHYWCIIGGCSSDGMNLGCEVWIARTLRLPDDTVLCVSPENIVLWHACPRSLVVSLRAGLLALEVAVLHAPCAKLGAAASDAFYNSVTCTLHSRDAIVLLVVLADANGTVGEICSSSVGSFHADPENYSGNTFHILLQNLDHGSDHFRGVTWHVLQIHR